MAKRPRLPRPLPVKKVLSDLLKPGDWHELELRQRLREAWDAVLPETLRPHTRLFDYRRQVLWVEASSNAWMQELQFLKPKLLVHLEQILGLHVINDLRIKVGPDWGGTKDREISF